MKCTYRLCDQTATVTITPPNGATPWHGCPTHYDAMVDALKVGCNTNDDITIEDILGQIGAEI